MTRIEKTEKVAACAETLFNVLTKYEEYARWNPMILKSEKNGKGYIFKTKTGEQNIFVGERIPFLKVSHVYEDKETGESFRIGADCKDVTVTFYASGKKIDETTQKETEIKLKSLKHYAEFLEKGGNPEHYSKLQVL